MNLSVYINAKKEPTFLLLRNGIEYLMYHPNEPIIYSRRNVFKLNEIPHQCFFKSGSVEIKKSQE